MGCRNLDISDCFIFSTEKDHFAAHFEYSPFGKIISENRSMPEKFAFRFSSEYNDSETGLVYYNYRYYDANMGRWINRDPIGERGGNNLYGFVGNDGVNGWDYFGLLVNYNKNVTKKEIEEAKKFWTAVNSKAIIKGRLKCFKELLGEIIIGVENGTIGTTTLKDMYGELKKSKDITVNIVLWFGDALGHFEANKYIKDGKSPMESQFIPIHPINRFTSATTLVRFVHETVIHGYESIAQRNTSSVMKTKGMKWYLSWYRKLTGKNIVGAGAFVHGEDSYLDISTNVANISAFNKIRFENKSLFTFKSGSSVFKSDALAIILIGKDPLSYFPKSE